MSFSGLKTAVVNLAHNAQQKGEPLDAPALARDFARAVSGELVPRAMARPGAYRTQDPGGRRRRGRQLRHPRRPACAPAARRASGCTCPRCSWCGDNGAMIGAQGYYEYLAGRTAGLDLNAYATMDLGAPLL